MIDTWSQFVELFSIGMGTGFTVGLVALAVRRIRLTTYNAFKSSMRF